MENMDFSKLKGFDHIAIHKKIDEYINMLESTDIETKMLAISLLIDDISVIHYLKAVLHSNEDYIMFKYYINTTLDELSSTSLKQLCTFRISVMLNNIRRGFNYCPYADYVRSKK